MDSKRATLKIERLPRGGYVVSTHSGQPYMQEALFACSDIDDALAFIKDELGEPEKTVKITDDERLSMSSLEFRERLARDRAQKYLCTCSTIRGQEHASYCPHSAEFDPGPISPTEPAFEDGIKARKYGGII